MARGTTACAADEEGEVRLHQGQKESLAVNTWSLGFWRGCQQGPGRLPGAVGCHVHSTTELMEKSQSMIWLGAQSLLLGVPQLAETQAGDGGWGPAWGVAPGPSPSVQPEGLASVGLRISM